MNEFKQAISLLKKVIETSEGCRLPFEEISDFLDNPKTIQFWDLAKAHSEAIKENRKLAQEMQEINKLSQRWLFN